MKVNPATLVPGRVIGARCGEMVESGTVSYRCTLGAGHAERGEPHYVVESARAVGTWQLWAAAHLPEEEHEHSLEIVDRTHARCTDPQCGAVVDIEPIPESAGDMASQFSAATGAQAALRAQQTEDRQTPPAPPPSVRTEPHEDPNDRHGYAADWARHTQPSVESTARRQVHDYMEPGPVEKTPYIEVVAMRVHIGSLDELELGDYVIDFDSDAPPTTGLTVMRVGRA